MSLKTSEAEAIHNSLHKPFGINTTYCDYCGDMMPCIQCRKPFFVPHWEQDIGEPKICSEECAEKWSH